MSDRRDMTIAEFCRRHDACAEGFDWATKNCETMQDVWRTAKPEWLVWVACCDGVLPPGKLMEAAIFFTRGIIHLVDDPDILGLWAAIERFAAGELAADQLWSMRDWIISRKEPACRLYEHWAVIDTAAANVPTTTTRRWARSAGAVYVESALENVADVNEMTGGIAVADRTRVEQAAWFREHAEPCFKI